MSFFFRFRSYLILVFSIIAIMLFSPLAFADAYSSLFLLPIDPPSSSSIPIASSAELFLIGSTGYPLTGSYYLTDDIDMLSHPWVPIVDFAGVLDGQGHVLYNLSILGDYSYTGLFANTTSRASIINLGLVNSYIDANFTNSTSVYIGSFTGNNAGSIINCFNIGDIVLSYDYTVYTGSSSHVAYVGGLAGRNAGNIDYCHNSGSVISTMSTINDNYSGTSNWRIYAGGICGQLDNGHNISYCYNNALMTAITSVPVKSNGFNIITYLGGISGYSYMNNYLSFCYNAGDLSAYAVSPFASYMSTSHTCASYAGGISGYVDSGSVISNCYNIGDILSFSEFERSSSSSVSATSYAGGLAGYLNIYSRILYSYSSCALNASSLYSNTNGTSYVGGLCGYMGASSLSTLSCYWNISLDHYNNEALLSAASKRVYGNISGSTLSLSDSQMKDISNYADYSISNHWCTWPDTNSGYPILTNLSYIPSSPLSIPEQGVVNPGTSIIVYCDNTIADIRYTLDGTDPSISGLIYIEPIVIYSSTFIKAVAIGSNGIPSAISNMAFIIEEETIPPVVYLPVDVYSVYVEDEIEINVLVLSTMEGSLSYQWFSNGSNSNIDGVIIPGANESFYVPDTSVPGDYFYS